MESTNYIDMAFASGRYRILKKIGKGAHGLVLKALDLDENKYVAVKVAFNKNGSFQRNFNEAQTIEKINKLDSSLSRYVIKITNWFTVNDSVITIMELKSGSLRQTLSEKKIKRLDRLSKYAVQMVEFLYFMFQLDIIHGDLKPENILHDDEEDELVFADFGLCYAPCMEYKPSLIQTPYYRAPEVFLGYDYSASADTWSIGCILVECMTGERLFHGRNDCEMMELIVSIVGTPNQEYIELAPKRCKYFTFNAASGLWILNGYENPTEPTGLPITKSKGHKNYAHFKKFMDLVRKMLCFEPKLRISPQEALDHPFLKMPNNYGFGHLNDKTRHALEKLSLEQTIA